MRSQFLTACLASVALLGPGFQAPTAAGPPDQESRDRPGKHKLVHRVYSVADLIIPVEKAVQFNCEGQPRASERACAPVSVLAAKHPGACAKVGEAACTHSAEQPIPAPTQEDRLMKLIASTIAPESWAERGGYGTIEYFSVGMALVVNQTPDVQEQIAELLATLRRLQDVQVVVEVRFVTLAESFFERIGLDFNIDLKADPRPPEAAPRHITEEGKPCGFVNECCAKVGAASPTTQDVGPRVAFLNDRQVHLFMEAAQRDPRTNIMHAPRMTILNGQSATFSVSDQQHFVTSVDLVQAAGGQVVHCPRNEACRTGVRLSLQPAVSADRRFVHLKLGASMTSLDSAEVPLFPVTTFITPVFESGAQGMPVPFTQFLQQPKFTTLALDKTLTIPDGGTVLLGGWRRLRETRHESGPPILTKIPYVNRLFKNVGYGQEAEHILVMATPRIIINEEEESRPVPISRPAEVSPLAPEGSRFEPKIVQAAVGARKGAVEAQEKPGRSAKAAQAPLRAKEKKLARLLAKYEQACSEGRLDDAHRLAARALTLDPACFSRIP
jgi:hypothetical protein